MKYWFILTSTLVILVGCSSTPQTNTTPPPPSRNYEPVYAPVVLTEDTVVATAGAGGLTYAPAPKAKTPPRTESLSKVGDEVVMKYGEAIFIVLDSLNPALVTVESVIDESTKTVTLRVLDKTRDVVILTHKCQTVDRVGGGAVEFPRIQLADGLSPEQVVVTPMCDEKNRMAGYSIRYGSEERGCQIQAAASLRSFHRCGDKLAPEKKAASKAKTASVRNETWRLLFYGDERK